MSNPAVDGSLVVVDVVKPDDHGRVFRHLDQQVSETVQATPPEHVNLVEEGPGLVELRIPGGEQTVKEERYLLFQRALGGDHPVDPVGSRAAKVSLTSLSNAKRNAGSETFTVSCSPVSASSSST